MSENYPKLDEQGNVVCQLCGKSFGILTFGHMKKCHNIGLSEYKTQFKDFPVSSQKFRDNQRKVQTQVHYEKTRGKDPSDLQIQPIENKVLGDQSINVPIIEELDIRSTIAAIVGETYEDSKPKKEIVLREPLIFDKKDIEEFVKVDIPKGTVVEETYVTNLKTDKTVFKGKRSILAYLQKLFPNVKENYFIESLSSSGHVLYRYVTDIADPIKKIAFFFPATFWHNRESTNIEIKERKLKKDGWTVVVISGINPTIDTVRKYLSLKGIG